MNKEKFATKIMDLAQLSLRFARVNRVTFHEDGATPESDTDHTVMLSLLACSIAHSYIPRLDVGKVAELALVHDMVEAYAGDTPTFKPLSKKEKNEKDAREHAAYERIQQEFESTFPWLPQRIAEYEARSSPESRFVKIIDKLVPKLTHILNGGVTLKTASVSKEDNHAWHDHEVVWAKDALQEFPEIQEVYLLFLERARNAFRS